MTPALLHGSFAHIGFNMYALFSFGTSLERYFGRGRFLTLYLLGAFAGECGVLPVLGCLLAGRLDCDLWLDRGGGGLPRTSNRKLLAGQFRGAIGNVLFIIAINLFLVGSLPGIDNWGHIGGLLGGLMFTWFASPLWEIGGIQPMLPVGGQASAREVVTGAVVGAGGFWRAGGVGDGAGSGR
ncbi:MAG: rhomboid family intramembrane serine protease [Candidatus Moduliflexus flocculans]|nr:rhomboid family intramembrane serine protease [Candidatus Moduliflexus flocculans]